MWTGQARASHPDPVGFKPPPPSSPFKEIRMLFTNYSCDLCRNVSTRAEGLPLGWTELSTQESGMVSPLQLCDHCSTMYSREAAGLVVGGHLGRQEVLLSIAYERGCVKTRQNSPPSFKGVTRNSDPFTGY